MAVALEALFFCATPAPLAPWDREVCFHCSGKPVSEMCNNTLQWCLLLCKSSFVS